MQLFEQFQFLHSFLSPRAKAMIEYAIKQPDYFSMDTLIEVGLKTPIPPLNKPIKHKSRVVRYIIFFIKIEFLLADPLKGLKFNSNFHPLNK